MNQKRTAQLIYQTIYCTLGLVGIIASFGIFDDYEHLRWDFYVHFTNISNFFCIGVMIAAMIQTLKKKNSYVSAVPMLKFVGMIGILLTFLVFNIFLAGAVDRNPQLNWRIGSICFHVVLPVMYIADWFLFYERKKAKWYYPLVSISFPLLYVVFIFLQDLILNFDSSIMIPTTSTPLVYPYFFLNLETQGQGKVALWIMALLLGFIAIGYLFFGLDRLSKKKNLEKKLSDSDRT